MTFGQRLGMLRKERGYTQKTFAQELSVTERCIRAYEMRRAILITLA